MKTKAVYIIAGPNGSGKTTFAKLFLPEYVKCPNFVNADLIAQGLAPFRPSTAAIKAGKLVLEQIREYAKRGVDFAFETTLSGKSYANLFTELKEKGYALHIFFLCEGVGEFQNKAIEIIDISAYQAPKVPSKQWRELIKKIWEIDPLICPGCGGEMKIIALLDNRKIAEKILKHLKLWTGSVPDKTRASPEAIAPDITYEPLYDDLQLDPEELAAGR